MTSYRVSYPVTFASAYGVRGVFGATGAEIRLSANTLPEGSAAGTAIGTLSVVGATGTAAFTLVDSASTKIALSGTNNVNVVAGATPAVYATTPSFTFTVSVSGVTPPIGPTTFTIAVTATGFSPSLDFSDARNSQYAAVA